LPGRLLLALPGVVVMVSSVVSSRVLAAPCGACQLRRLTVPGPAPRRSLIRL
jgi:hypothetical protein